MTRLILLAAALSACASPRTVERAKLPVDACVKWNKDIPGATAAGEGLFASFRRVEGAGPHHGCAVVSENETFGVGWLMSAYMKQSVVSPCGKPLGRYSFRYKGEEWQEKLATGLHDFLRKNPGAADAAKECPAPAPARPVDLSPTPYYPPPTEPTATPAAPATP